jgi:putative two-component system response regulator
MGQSLNVLLVEDCEDDLLFFRLGIGRTREVALTHVLTAQEAIDFLERGPLPDLIVMDLMLPGMSLDDFLRWFRSNPRVQSIPIVIYTGAPNVSENLTSLVSKTFFKSGDLTNTRSTVQEMLDMARPHRGGLPSSN